MGAGTHALTGERSPERLEARIEALRHNLSSLLDELGRRRHELTDWRLQASRHKTGLAIGGSGLALLGGLAYAGSRWVRRRRAERAITKLKPRYLFASEPGLGRWVLLGGAVGVASWALRRGRAES